MKKLLILIALGSVTSASADQYNQSCPNCYRGGGQYQDQSNYNQNRQNTQGYYQRNDQDQNYQKQGNQSYNGNNPQRNYNNNYGDNQKNVSDQEIRRNIEDALSSGWFSRGFQNVSADVNNGNVNLRGTVDTLENKSKVEDRVRKIDGVRQINNQITVSSERSNGNAYSDSDLQNSEKKYSQDMAATPQDRQLNARIRERLGSGWFSKGYDTLVIRTSNGIVVISGAVDGQDDVQKINDQVKNIEGVKSVNNQLTVKNR